MYRHSEDDGCGLMIVRAVASALARGLAIIIVFGVVYFWQFVVNPGENYSVEIYPDEVMEISGVDCDVNPSAWRFTMLKTWPSSKHSHAEILLWRRVGQVDEDIQRVELTEWGELRVGSCGDDVNVAFIWQIDSSRNSMHLRVHPAYRLHILEKVEVPGVEGLP